jgi:hypothetical protein
MRRLCSSLALAAVFVAASPSAKALTASGIFAKTHHAIYLVIVNGDEPGVVDVIAQGSAVLIAPGRFVTNCHVLEGGKHFVISRREEKVIERALLVNYQRGQGPVRTRPGATQARIRQAGGTRSGRFPDCRDYVTIVKCASRYGH